MVVSVVSARLVTGDFTGGAQHAPPLIPTSERAGARQDSWSWTEEQWRMSRRVFKYRQKSYDKPTSVFSGHLLV